MDDPRASASSSRALMRDRDPQVAQTAIQRSYNGGPEVDQALTQIVNDPSAKDELKAAAANQLRGRGTDLDDATEQTVTKLAGPALRRLRLRRLSTASTTSNAGGGCRGARPATRAR